MKESLVDQMKRDNNVFKKELELVMNEFEDFLFGYVFDVKILEVKFELV